MIIGLFLAFLSVFLFFAFYEIHGVKERIDRLEDKDKKVKITYPSSHLASGLDSSNYLNTLTRTMEKN
jgi:hypothetical protein